MNYIVWHRGDNEVIGGLFESRSEAQKWEDDLPEDHEIIPLSPHGVIPTGEVTDLQEFIRDNFPTENPDYFKEALEQLQAVAEATGDNRLVEITNSLNESFLKATITVASD